MVEGVGYATPKPVLGGSLVMISRVLSTLMKAISLATILIALVRTTHEPPRTP